ncbi:ABC transporter permease subunit [Pandoraea nosoerga]|uniref:Nitrate ABC transporter permease n=1 Tax=Pandoraea nosoerga TaxID=2508296 RepID=A0A5E4RCW6_9BURK|nr:ABC transporter permease subunit [Pandoraea nosoerga]MBN4666736.1 ABC transporter permease subunit [Pandoraea nosoerga]MBN4676884.1 ABC transporter permease subunit [Pandoraea nosoerga]MBN4681509.1 ABC transporter permease subunit [Pandoraea nosoerga]MBN4746003.1 ABC transporter permease subunit [Pandoraea nosoerga]VVD61015.1 nitrate ABC transporter permease [Pandoraea nosoerga]
MDFRKPNPLGTLAVVFVLIGLWQTVHWLNGSALGSPAATARELWAMMGTASFWADAAQTGEALAFSLVIAIAGGVALGLVLGANRLAANVAEPILVNLYSLPKVTLYPLVLLIFGLGLAAKVAFGVMHGLIPILIFTMNGIRQIKPVYFRAAHAMHLSRRQIALRVVLPAVLPEVLSGVRLGFSLTLLGVLIGEMFASQKGLGHQLSNAMNLGNIDTIMAVALFLMLFALAGNTLLSALSRRLGAAAA